MKPTTPLASHPYAEIFPLMDAGTFAALKKSIESNGQREPIVLFEGKILDGRNTYRACLDLKIEPKTRAFDPKKDGVSPVAFVMDRNLERRHLTASQRAAAATSALPHYQAEALKRRKLTEAKPGQKVGAAPPPAPDAAPGTVVENVSGDDTGTATSQAAAAFHVSETSVKQAAALQTEAPAAFAAVAAGTATLHEAVNNPSQVGGEVVAEAMRLEHLDSVKRDMGDDFARAFAIGAVCKTVSDVKEFVALNAVGRKRIETLLVQGWGVKKANKFLDETPGLSTTVADLLLRVASSGGKPFKFVVANHTITIAPVKAPAAAPDPTPASE